VQALTAAHGLGFQSIQTATRGILFLATPHGGSSVANRAAPIANLLRESFRPGLELLRDLRKDSDATFELGREFDELQVQSGWRIYNFWEGKRTRIFRLLPLRFTVSSRLDRHTIRIIRITNGPQGRKRVLSNQAFQESEYLPDASQSLGYMQI
jgi:hypothetical protein